MEQFQVRGTAARRAPGTRREAIVGARGDGDLEVLRFTSQAKTSAGVKFDKA